MISLKFLFMVITTITIVQTSLAQNTPQDFVNAHNAARAAVGVGNIVWDTTVAAYAQNYPNQRMSDCALQHSGSTLYGENIAKGSSAFMTGTAAVQLWVKEKSFYDYTTNTCATGKVCGHYTQVVWSNSTSLGCARVQCNNGWYFVTCNYYPRGNVGTQKPY